MVDGIALNERMIAIVTQGDMAWFEAHPDSRLRMRNAVPMEFDEDIGVAPVGMTWRCIVVEAQPGVRVRQPVALPVALSNDSLDDQQLFRLFMEAAPPEAKRMIDQLRAIRASEAPGPTGSGV
jgi:hypothetical protein